MQYLKQFPSNDRFDYNVWCIYHKQSQYQYIGYIVLNLFGSLRIKRNYYYNNGVLKYEMGIDKIVALCWFMNLLELTELFPIFGFVLAVALVFNKLYAT